MTRRSTAVPLFYEKTNKAYNKLLFVLSLAIANVVVCVLKEGEWAILFSLLFIILQTYLICLSSAFKDFKVLITYKWYSQTFKRSCFPFVNFD